MENFDVIRDQTLKVNEDGSIITLRDVQTIQLEILVEIKRICEKRNIQYFLEAGTLLGAVRHSGFIPWDDDLDISIYKNAYQELIKALKEELDQTRFEFHCLETTRKYNITGPAVKVKRKGTYSPEPHNWLVNRTGDNGLFVDIFVYDDAKNYNFRMKYYRLLSKVSAYLNVFLDGIGLSLRVLKQQHIKISQKYSKKYKDSQCFCSRLTWTYTKSWIYKKNDFFPLIKMNFEGIEVPVPNNYHDVLSEHYGDYMKFPCKHEMRFRHIKPKKLEIDSKILEAIRNDTLIKR